MQTVALEGYRLAPQQRQLWLTPQHLARVQCALLLTGVVHTETLREALQQVVKRHEILRTAFRALPGMKTPLQVINEEAVLAWRQVSLSEAEWAALWLVEAQRESDWQNEPALRAVLAELPERRLLLLNLPALCADQRTLRNLAAEIAHSYAALLRDEISTSEPLQYVRFAEWQNELLTTPEAGDYWRTVLQGAPSFKLPFEGCADTEQRSEPVKIELPETLLAQQETPDTFLLACWHVLLWRLTGETDLLTGVVSAGRDYEELQEALGLFAKTLPLRAQLTGAMRFDELLVQLQQSLREGAEQQDYFAWEQYSDAPLLTVGFEFNEWPSTAAGALQFTLAQQHQSPATFRLKLAVVQADNAVRAALQFAPAFQQRAQVERCAQQFATLVDSALANPQAPLAELNSLPAAERLYLLTELNQTAAAFPAEQCWHELFEAQAARTPEAAAVVSAGRQLTYAELNAQANRLAHYLQKQGVGPDVCVGLCVDRSVEMLVGLLGILKAGGAYVPLNAEQPQARLALQLADAGAPVLITQEKLASHLPAFAGTTICLDRDQHLLQGEASDKPVTAATAENLVYVIYTSGSTGVPKGVAVTQRNLVNYTQAIRAKLRLTNNDAPLHFATVTTITADLGNTCVFPALSMGGCLYIIDYETATDGQLFAQYLSAQPIDVLKIVPSHLSALLTAAGGAVLPRQYLILGGEALSWELSERLRQAAPPALQIINHYGPTETTVGSLTLSLNDYAQASELSATVPLGRPLANTTTYIFDERRRPVPIGVVGELYIGGAGVARGYLNQPELTAAKFISRQGNEDKGIDSAKQTNHSFALIPLSEAGERLYRTGDLARYLPDGSVEFLGRVDHQIKIRGFRVELGEIEAVLRRQPAVREAVVVAREDEAGEKSLTAYFSLAMGQSAAVGELREFLQERLPDYMVPAAFVQLEALPLTRNGKLDRQALPAPEQAMCAANFVAPRNEIEELLAALWADVLRRAQVGVKDDFFALGGHSLLVTQVAARVRETFQIELPLRSFFEATTIAALAERVAAARRGACSVQIPPLTPQARNGQAPLSFAQQRLWFLEQLEPGSCTYNLPRALRLRGNLNVAALQQTLAEITARHEVLRTNFATVNEQPVQIVQERAAITLPVIPLDHLPQAERATVVKQLLHEEAHRPFDLTRDALLRTRLLRLDEREHVLLLTLHHIVSDGWSAGALFRELSALYEACTALRRAESLAPLPLQYADYALWQRQWLQGAALEQQLAWWREHLAGELPTLALPIKQQPARAENYEGARCVLTLSTELSAALKDLSRRESVTLFMTLLAAFQTLLHHYTQQDDIIIGTPIAGRNRVELEALIGFFVNTLVLRTDLSGEPSFRELLRRVRETALGAYTHQDVPFEKLVEELQPERRLDRTPLFQVMFALQNAPQQALTLAGLELEWLETTLGAAKFDLGLTITEHDGQLTATLDYRKALFDDEAMRRMLGHYQNLLTGIVAEPEQKLSLLPLLAEAERRQILVEWNDTAVAYPADRCVQQLFAAQVAAAPEAVAVTWNDSRLTYGELDARANQLAHYLQKRGVGPETLVAVCLPRSPEAVVALLGILKAGGAYLPIDPAYPAERSAFILDDARPVVIIQNPKSEIQNLKLPTINLVTDWPVIAQESTATPINTARPDNLAYVIYTSGSSGQPKGVLITQQALVNHALAAARYYELQAHDRALQAASLSFDVAVEEIFSTLLAGATLTLLPEQALPSIAEFLHLLEREHITVVNLPTAYWHELTSELARGELTLPPSLRLLITGTEEALPEKLAHWRKLTGERVRWINAYGPTEATVTTTAYEPPPALDASELRSVPIGKPLANRQVYVLDRHLQPVPIGVPGELCIGGASLARGYLNQPELTAAKFVHRQRNQDKGIISARQTNYSSALIPLSEADGRLYRTGDLARWLPDGNLEFLGRVDEQVKVRGFRIEPGEIEAALAAHPAIKEAAVVAKEYAAGDKRLVAYFAPQERTQTGVSERMELWPSVGEYQVYDELLYAAMTNDEVRNRSYQAAAQRFVKDKIVIEVGTGKDAILARFCVAAGAKRVYAIECLEESWRQALETVQQLGLENKIIPVLGDAAQVQLPEQADVCISEIIGTLGGSEGVAQILNDARRHLKPGGLMIPHRCVTKFAAVTLPDEIARDPGFSALSSGYVQKVLEQVGYPFDVRLCLSNFPASHILSDAGVFEDLAFNQHTNTEYEHTVTLTIEQQGRVDGFLLWIKLDTGAGAVIDSLAQRTSWLPVYFPVFAEGVTVAPGDQIKAVCRAVLSDNGVNPDYEVRGAVLKQNGEVVEFEYVSAHHAPVNGERALYRQLFKDGAVRIQQRAETVDPAVLRALLSQSLPEYMIPSAFIEVDALPRLPGGKLNRRALLELNEARPTQAGQFVAPGNEAETKLAAMWAELLQLDRVSIHDNFFALGGHSLLATQIVSRIRRVFGVELPLRAFFAGPTVAELARAILTAQAMQQNNKQQLPQAAAVAAGSLSEQRRTLLDALLRAEGLSTTARITRQRDRSNLPLSFAQARLWFLEQLEPGSQLYHIPQALRLSGALNVEALQRAWITLTARHETLRTTFRLAAGEPVQVIAPTAETPLPLTDLTALPEVEREREVRRRAQEDAQQSFDLTRGPLWRVQLLRLGAAEHVLLFNLHHIISDGWSAGLLWRELATLYEAYDAGRAQSLPELPIQYADYAVWQRDYLQGAELERQLNYWRAQLTGAPELLELPADYPRPPVQSFCGAKEVIFMPHSLLADLKKLSQAQGATLFMTLLAAFQTLLHRYTGQDDIVTGTPIAGRNREELEGLLGCFVNTLVLRSDLSGDPAFTALLARVKETTLGAYEHQELPFEKLVEELQPARSLSHAPLFQVFFALQNAPAGDAALAGLQVSPCSSAQQETAKFDLSLFVSETDEGLRCAVEYSTDLFEAATIKRLLGHYQTLLTGLAAAPQQPLSALPLLTAPEQRQILVEWNQTQQNYPTKLCVHELFAAQVERTPAATALICGRERLTYAELNRRANQIAWQLKALGVGAETRVGLCLERSAAMVSGVLGVLKAGGAYVPLDPAYPAERLNFMLEDSGAEVILTQERLRAQLAQSKAQMICLDATPESTAAGASNNPPAATRAENLAYVIYTSGSTGRPKGVAIEHRNTSAFLHWALSVFTPEQLCGVLASTSICFDLSVFELFAPLSCGGAVILAENILQLPELPAAQEVTLINTVPSALAELVRYDKLPPFARTVNLAGEPLSRALSAKLYQQETVAQVFNLYGPTEDTTYSTYTLVEKNSAREPTIGRPLANTQTYILDRHFNPMPIGIPGELYLGGAGLARGYLNRPELTAEKFVQRQGNEDKGIFSVRQTNHSSVLIPLSVESGRLYRTGDLARYLPDGQIEYLGRLDQQVKIRGYRIELGEIEAVLQTQPGVKEAIVLAREDEPGEKQLVAYLVAAPEATAADLRERLRRKLPEYMLPAAFVFLPQLPLTPNGKLDRRALPKPDGATRTADSFVAPRNALEEVIAGVWAEVLKLDRVSIDDNFFALGGHSLRAMQTVSRLRDALGVELPLRALFESPMVAGLAALLRADPQQRIRAEKTAELLLSLAQLSEDEVTAALAQQQNNL